MSLPEEVDLLVIQLAASLEPSRHHAFIDAARSALAGIPCLGPGSAYRVLAQLQKRFFDPPSDTRTVIGPYHRTNKLTSLPAVSAVEDPRSVARRRAMWGRS
jgi:hypothetical protein